MSDTELKRKVLEILYAFLSNCNTINELEKDIEEELRKIYKEEDRPKT